MIKVKETKGPHGVKPNYINYQRKRERDAITLHYKIDLDIFLYYIQMASCSLSLSSFLGSSPRDLLWLFVGLWALLSTLLTSSLLPSRRIPGIVLLFHSHPSKPHPTTTTLNPFLNQTQPRWTPAIGAPPLSTLSPFFFFYFSAIEVKKI